MSDQIPFTLHERLQADTHEVARLALCRVLLMNDRSVPWLILVPQRPGLTEIHDLNTNDRIRLIEEISCASETIQQLFAPDKINVGMLGNLVSQLHIHVIARYKTDRAWPGPIWGTGPALPYHSDETAAIVDRLRASLVSA